ncbi:MAG TPA: hypothetical protein VFK05_03015 [Polyangiaceae bacterium]|nr:hypothetical protein [Polyangiaceae bacterium]
MRGSFAHYDLAQLIKDARGFASVHVVGPDLGCYTPGERDCVPSDVAPFGDLGQLALATGGTFTTLPDDGTVELTALPLSGVIESTEKCTAALPADAAAVRCVYEDDKGHKGEVVIDLPKKP